jgi:hypothetical protein
MSVEMSLFFNAPNALDEVAVALQSTLGIPGSTGYG